MRAVAVNRDNAVVRQVRPLIRCECGREQTEPPAVPLIDVTELAQWLATSQRHIRRLVEERRVPHLKIGHYVRFDPADIEGWLERQRVSMEVEEAPSDGPPWVRLAQGAHRRGGTAPSTPSRQTSEIGGGDPPWIRSRSTREK